MRTLTFAAVAALSIIISNQVMAQDGIRRLGDFQNAPVPVSAVTVPTPVSAPAVSFKRCSVEEISGGWRSSNCNTDELRMFLAQQGIQTSAPRAYAAVTPSGGITDAERQRRESLTFDEQLRQQQVAFNASVADTQAERADKRQGRCEGRALGRELLGGLASAATSVVASRLSSGRGYYYRGGGGYYGPRGSECYSGRY